MLTNVGNQVDVLCFATLYSILKVIAVPVLATILHTAPLNLLQHLLVFPDPQFQ